MSMAQRPVNIHQIPSEISSALKTELLRRIEMSVESGHPRIVLDCSQMESLGASEIHFLLCCLEEAMKHNGDVKLAGLQPLAQATMRTSGVGRLFEIYATADDAVASYQPRSIAAAPQAYEALRADSEYAA